MVLFLPPVSKEGLPVSIRTSCIVKILAENDIKRVNGKKNHETGGMCTSVVDRVPSRRKLRRKETSENVSIKEIVSKEQLAIVR